MTARSTRNKLRFQGFSALNDLRHAQDHLIGLAALADDQSPYINDNLPLIMTGLDTVQKALDKFYEGL